MRRRPVVRVFLLLVLYILVRYPPGSALYEGSSLPEKVRKDLLYDAEAVLEGTAQSIRETDSSFIILLSDAILTDQSKRYPCDKVRVYFNKERDLSGLFLQNGREAVFSLAGDRLLVRGELKRAEGARNPGEFDFRRYLACRHVFYEMRKPEILKRARGGAFRKGLSLCRMRLQEFLKRHTGEEGTLLLSLFTGERYDPRENDTLLLLQAAGVLSLFSLSGIHLSAMGRGSFGFLKKTGAGLYAAAFLSAAFVFLFSSMTEGGTGMFRAEVCFLCLMLSRILGRIYDLPSALSFAGILMLLDSPLYLYDSGFQMSLCAGCAVVCAGALDARQRPEKKPRRFRRSPGRRFSGSKLLLMLSLHFFLLPLVLHTYGQTAAAGFLLNYLLYPLLPLLIFSVFSGCLTGLLVPEAGALLLLPARLIAKTAVRLCGGVLSITAGLCMTGSPSVLRILIYYILLISAVLLLFYLRKPPWRARIGAAALLSAALLVLASGRPAGKMASVTCLDIGQGDCIVIGTPEGHAFLFDAGSTSRENIGRYQLLPYLKHNGISHLDAVFVSHTDLDHVSGIEELLRLTAQGISGITVGEVILPSWEKPPELYDALVVLAEQAGASVSKAAKGDVYRSGEVSFYALWPPYGAAGTDVNDESLVMRFEYGDFSALLTGDIGSDVEEKLLPQISEVSLLKVAHHGSRFSSSESFLEKASPAVSVISCARQNSYGHPAEETVRRLSACGTRIEYTMKSGAVTVMTDGERMYTERFVR